MRPWHIRQGVSEHWGQTKQVPASMELAFQCQRGTADTARTGHDRKQTEYRGNPRSLCEWLTFELLKLAGPLTSWVTWREFLNLPAPASGLVKEQETVVARGGGCGRATCFPTASSLNSPAPTLLLLRPPGAFPDLRIEHHCLLPLRAPGTPSLSL